MYYLLSIHLICCIAAFIAIRKYNASVLTFPDTSEVKMSYFSALAGILYFIIEHRSFEVGEIPDDLTQDPHVPDDSKHFDTHLFID